MLRIFCLFGLDGNGSGFFWERFAKPEQVAAKHRQDPYSPGEQDHKKGGIHILSIMVFMTIVNGLCFWLLLPSAGLLAGPVEVVVNGDRYPSLQAYQESKKYSKHIILGAEAGSEADSLKAEALRLGVMYDPLKIKTITLVSTGEALAIQRLVDLGVEKPMGQVVTDFHQNWDQATPNFTLAPEELEARLKSLVEGRKEPVLLMSGPNKLRVMSLKHEGSKQSP